MKVTLPILSATGTYVFKVDTDNLVDARQEIREGRGLLISSNIDKIILNYDAIAEPPEEEPALEGTFFSELELLMLKAKSSPSIWRKPKAVTDEQWSSFLGKLK